jgi:phosphoribosylaminoimidazole-succinocarboxamide synthase
MICRRLDMIAVEAVARGYLTGGGLLDYRASGEVCGIALPPGLVDGDRLPEPIFTPAAKAAVGEHDENVSFAAVVATVGPDLAGRLRDKTLEIYAAAATIAAERGILLADTKFEFGLDPVSGELVLADEVLTPDSSRFWPAESYQPGHPQASFDKQYVRDWLTSPASGWDRAADQPPPPLPPEVAAATRQRYVEAYERLTGLSFADWIGPRC